MYFPVSMVVSLLFGTSLIFFQPFSLRSPFTILQHMSSFYFACFYFFLFSCIVAIAISPLLFRCLGFHAVLCFSLPFLILATIFIAVTFLSLSSILLLFSQTAIITAFRSLSFVGLPFLFWSCRCHIHLAATDAFIVTTGCHPVFFLLFWLLFSSFSHQCFYCHFSADSNSRTVVLSKPASYSPALFSIPMKNGESGKAMFSTTNEHVAAALSVSNKRKHSSSYKYYE